MYIGRATEIHEHFFGHIFGASVNARHFADGRVFGDGQTFGISIDGARAGENQLVAAVSFHYLMKRFVIL